MHKKIPKKARRVYKGYIFDVYKWRQKMYDGSSGLFESVKRENTVEIIASVKDKVIVLYQIQPNRSWYYSLPSGRMDKKGESPKQTALRELLEETGYKPKSIKLWKTFSTGGKIVHDCYVFLARDCEKVAKQQLDGGEKIKVMLCGFEEFLKITDKDNCHFYPPELMKMLLLARIHKKNYADLKKAIFGK